MNKTNSTLIPLFSWHIPEEYLPYSRAHPKFTTPAVSNTSRLLNFFITAQNCRYIPFHQNKGSLMKHHRLYFSIKYSIKSFHIVLRMIDHFCIYDPLIKTNSPLSLLKSCLNTIWILQGSHKLLRWVLPSYKLAHLHQMIEMEFKDWSTIANLN
jgi:hypothetical protein